VVIVGGGPAGLACAEALFEVGVEFVVLEARGRVGGRAFTDPDLAPGIPVELGAQMVHGRHGATHAWLEESGLKCRRYPTTLHGWFRSGDRFSSTLGYLLPRPGPFGLRSLLRGVRTIPRELLRPGRPGRTLAGYLDHRREPAGSRLLVELLQAHAWAADPEEIGLDALALEEKGSAEPFGFRNYQVLHGYSELMRRRAAYYGPAVRLGQEVRSIRWGPRGVQLTAVDRRTGVEQKHEAGRAVITVPLGVLRSGGIEFDPSLPAEKLGSLQRTGFGSALVTAIRFRRPEVPRRLGRTILLWGGGPTSFLRPSFGLRGSEEVWVGFTAGREARRRAQLLDAEVAEAVLEELRSFSPGAPWGAPAGVVIARWGTDPFAQGAYSFPSIRSRPGDRTELARPVGERLFFAGEATHCGGEAGTVHGAIESGWRAAREVVESLQPSSSVRTPA
jgi:monoamine oxidase